MGRKISIYFGDAIKLYNCAVGPAIFRGFCSELARVTLGPLRDIRNVQPLTS